MKELNIKIPVVFKQEDELSEDEHRLLKEAKEAPHRSYSPYSHFSVGAAVLLDDGTIVCGSNQENSAFPSGLCAERTALFYANSRYPDHAVKALCIAARDTNGEFTEQPVAPCGSCRQVMVETEVRYGSNIQILLYGRKGIYCLNSARDTLPVHFDGSFLIH